MGLDCFSSDGDEAGECPAQPQTRQETRQKEDFEIRRISGRVGERPKRHQGKYEPAPAAEAIGDDAAKHSSRNHSESRRSKKEAHLMRCEVQDRRQLWSSDASRLNIESFDGRSGQTKPNNSDAARSAISRLHACTHSALPLRDLRFIVGLAVWIGTAPGRVPERARRKPSR
jgi:hypothetical protein